MKCQKNVCEILKSGLHGLDDCLCFVNRQNMAHVKSFMYILKISSVAGKLSNFFISLPNVLDDVTLQV